MALTLQQLNAAGADEAARLLDGLYEHSPWIAQAALAQRPFQSLAHLKHVHGAHRGGSGPRRTGRAGARPPRAGRQGDGEQDAHGRIDPRAGQGGAGGLHARRVREDPAAQRRLQRQVRLSLRAGGARCRAAPASPASEIIETFERRLDNPPDFELAECLRNIHRIAELRLNDKFGFEPALGNWVWDWLEALAQYSDPGYREKGQLTVTYLTDAHRQAAARIAQDMRDCGFDEVTIDAVGNVVGIYFGKPADALPWTGEGWGGVGPHNAELARTGVADS